MGEGGEQLGVVVADIADAGADWPGGEGGVGGAEQGDWVAFLFAEPDGPVVWFEDDGHAVMQGLEGGAGLGGENGEAAQDGAVRVAPAFPETGERHGGAVGAGGGVGLFGFGFAGPFVEGVRGDEAAAAGEGVAEHRGFGCGFATGVDGFAGGGEIGGEMGDEAPVEQVEAAFAGGGDAQDRGGLGGGDVPAWGEVGHVAHGCEDGAEFVDGAVEDVAAAHGLGLSGPWGGWGL